MKRYKPIMKMFTLAMLVVGTFYIAITPTPVLADIFSYGICLENANNAFGPCLASCNSLPPSQQGACSGLCGSTYINSVFGCRISNPPNHRNYARCSESSSMAYRFCMTSTDVYSDCGSTSVGSTQRETCCGQVKTDEFLACYYP
jgi:hypothetical protein